VAARETWGAVAAVFERTEPERRWAALARAGLSELNRRPPAAPDPERVARAVAAGVAEADRLKAAGKTAEADGLLRSLAELYHDSPAAIDQLKRAGWKP
jgi:hypothetical protein